VTLAGETMGTTWRVLAALREGRAVEPLREAIDCRLDGLVAEMSHWQPGSELCRYNRSLPGWLDLAPDFATVIAAALDVAQQSDGAFDPAIGAMVDLWGFGPAGAQPGPSNDALLEARARSGWKRLSYDRAARRLHQPGGVQLDLSGIAKGYAADALGQLLLQQRCSNFLVEIGGELVGAGLRPDSEPWWVELEDGGAGLLPIRVALHEMAVATSGSYVRGDHTIDPRIGRPCANDIVAVSVLHSSAMLADAWASALTVLGGAEGMEHAIEMGIAARFVLRSNGGFTESISPALAALL
jgi:FAD:protein FMN transferase